ncbi:MAG TPA: hypothetical protein VFR31_21015 [Thermoanaerobaculia bacterium]|nr:hypothetical protein [Thermoanaerobaculia bacterium]
MASRSSLESQVQESQLREHLGPPLGLALRLGPRPLRLDPASAVLLGIAAGLLTSFLRLGLFLIFGLAAAACVAFLALRRSRRATLTPFERGLVFESRGTKRTFLLEDLQLELRERDVAGGLMRKVALANDQGRVRFEHFVPKGQPDRLGGMLVHLLSRLVEVTERKLRAGETVTGRDWVLGPDGLSAPAHDHPIPLAEIGSVTVRQNKVALWRPQERYPFFVLPADSPNALVLVTLLSQPR